MAKPVYLFSGFLDAGKTSVIKETMYDVNFNDEGKNLIVAFEEGDEEYDKKFLKATKSEVVFFETIKDFTKKKQTELDKEYQPDRILIEFNGMEDEKELFKIGFIKEWELAQVLTIFDASKFNLYNTNMKQFVYNHVVNAECCIFNRIEGVDKRYLRNNLKAINPRLEIIYVDKNGDATNKIEDNLFDTSKDLDIDDNDYGLWYMDANDFPEKYDNKKISLKMKFLSDHPQENVVIMGRNAMVCCANDISPIGMMVMTPTKIEKDKYYKVTGTLRCIRDDQGFVLLALLADKAEEVDPPKEDLVYFN